jgi:FkbM family methyltransferase
MFKLGLVILLLLLGVLGHPCETDMGSVWSAYNSNSMQEVISIFHSSPDDETLSETHPLCLLLLASSYAQLEMNADACRVARQVAAGQRADGYARLTTDLRVTLNIIFRACPGVAHGDRAVLDEIFHVVDSITPALLAEPAETREKRKTKLSMMEALLWVIKTKGVPEAKLAQVTLEALALKDERAWFVDLDNPSQEHKRDLLPERVPDRAGFNVVRMTAVGLMLYNPHDTIVGTSLNLFGEWSVEEAQLFSYFLRRGYVCIDGGANFGTLTLPLSRFVGSTGLVIAFEPQRLVSQALAGTLALNSITNVVLKTSALGEKPGSEGGNRTIIVPVINPHWVHNGGSLSIAGAAPYLPQHDPSGILADKVDIVAIDSLELPRLDFMKLDVEFMELEALKGAAATIRSHTPVIFMETNYEQGGADKLDPRSHAALDYLMATLEYDCWWHWHPLYPPLAPGTTNKRGFYMAEDDKEGKNVFTIYVNLHNVLCISQNGAKVAKQRKRLQKAIKSNKFKLLQVDRAALPKAPTEATQKFEKNY